MALIVTMNSQTGCDNIDPREEGRVLNPRRPVPCGPKKQ